MDHQIFEVHTNKKLMAPKPRNFLLFLGHFPVFSRFLGLGGFSVFLKKMFFFVFLVWDILHRPHPHSMVPYFNGSGTISAEP